MSKLQKDGPEKIVYRGKIFEIVKQPMKAGGKKIVFEMARRSPGVRLIIVKDDKMLITREFRTELDTYDYRLPGGKVFDTLKKYDEHLGEDILPFAIEAAKRECKEEVGLIANDVEYFVTAKAGATVVWDLIYFTVDEFVNNKAGQELEAGEVIDVEWRTFNEVKELIKAGSFSEDRSAGVLFKYFLQLEGSNG